MIFVIIFLVAAALLAGDLVYSVGRRHGINMARQGRALPPKCVHVEARWGTWNWFVDDHRVRPTLYCVDCGTEFKYNLPVEVQVTYHEDGHKTGSYKKKAVRLALEAKGWHYDEVSDVYQHTRIES